ncbi:MAG: hypothetical protein KBB52_05560, partial [Candidatus Omnitrophica bacterium]|nr:hypothetical protein [Candidatus Omnitrophota bacterium]
SMHPSENPSRPKQTMYISRHEFRIEERSAEHGFRAEVVYHTVPGEDFPAIARTIKVENLASEERCLEMVDGMPKISPFGLNEWFMKNMSRTIEAWMETTGITEKRPLYRLRVDAADVAEVKHIKSGNFYLSILRESGVRPAIIADPMVVFGSSGDLVRPDRFASQDFRMPISQIDRNITPSAFSYFESSLMPLKTITLSSLAGLAGSPDHLRSIDKKISSAFFDKARDLNKLEIDKVARSVSVFSGSDLFDAYVAQTNLDNILRGGLPIKIGHDGRVIYVFNRKHGDLERDYNNFTVRAENFAQGNGNYRDANQNRRLSVWLCPSVSTKDIKDFFELAQMDGYNPLVIKGDRFSVRKDSVRRKIASRYFPKSDAKAVCDLLSGEFTIGELMDMASSCGISAKRTSLLSDVAACASCSIAAEHGEGYWVDHWTYNMDLVESYLALYPEKKDELLFKDRSYRFFDNDHVVKPRSEKVALDAYGRVRQYRSVTRDPEKKKLIASRKEDPNWLRIKHGKGNIYRSNLAAKMLIIVINKISSLDPSGIGIEMEADKPGWCDSLNGLPGLFGSSCCETFELARMMRFLISNINSTKNSPSLYLPQEAASFMRGLTSLFKDSSNNEKGNRSYWEKSNFLKEKYREAVRLGVSGKETKLDTDEVLEFLLGGARRLSDGIKRSLDPAGIPYTYFVNEASGIDKKKNIASFKSRPLPLFLEGVVHALKIQDGQDGARRIYNAVKASSLYDKELGMYKLNTSIEKESLEIGRSRAFTPGWLENESIWLHMEYKYLLEILKCGLHEEFFSDMKKALIPFQEGERYGRSILENSSFLTSSVFFDHSMVGGGFYARLSGATVELLNMLQIMNLGVQPFTFRDGRLFFTPSPILKPEFFGVSEKVIDFNFKKGARKVTLPQNSYAFSLFANTIIVYENPRLKETFGKARVKPVRYEILYASGKKKSLDGESLPEPFSKDLRCGLIDKITISLE